MPYFISSASFAGRQDVGFVSPIADASVCAWVGMADPELALRNWGTTGDCTLVGTSTQVDDLFRRFDYTNFLQLDATVTHDMTIIALARSVSPITDFYGVIASTERVVSATDKRGVTMLRDKTSPHQFRATAFGTTGAAQTFQNTGAVGPTEDAAPAVLCLEVQHQGTGGIKMRMAHLNDPATTSTWATNTNDTLIFSTDDASYPIRVGSSYLSGSTTIGAIDIGFVMVVPRLLSDKEKAAVRAPITARATAFGFSA